jgi:hypothetical protein
VFLQHFRSDLDNLDPAVVDAIAAERERSSCSTTVGSVMSDGTAGQHVRPDTAYPPLSPDTRDIRFMTIGVSTVPGCTEFARIRCGASSIARDFINPTSWSDRVGLV